MAVTVTQKGRIALDTVMKVKGFADVKAKFDVLAGSISNAAKFTDEFLGRAAKLQGLLDAQTISTDKAAVATKGLISQYELVEAANRGVALGVKLTDESFADLAAAATVVSRKMGTDVNKAIGDLMTGLGRQSRMILDNLGIIVKAEEAYDKYAASIGKRPHIRLSESEKRIAFQTEALYQLR